MVTDFVVVTMTVIPDVEDFTCGGTKLLGVIEGKEHAKDFIILGYPQKVRKGKGFDKLAEIVGDQWAVRLHMTPDFEDFFYSVDESDGTVTVFNVLEPCVKYEIEDEDCEGDKFVAHMFSANLVADYNDLEDFSDDEGFECDYDCEHCADRD